MRWCLASSCLSSPFNAKNRGPAAFHGNGETRTAGRVLGAHSTRRIAAAVHSRLRRRSGRGRVGAASAASMGTSASGVANLAHRLVGRSTVETPPPSPALPRAQRDGTVSSRGLDAGAGSGAIPLDEVFVCTRRTPPPAALPPSLPPAAGEREEHSHGEIAGRRRSSSRDSSNSCRENNSHGGSNDSGIIAASEGCLSTSEEGAVVVIEERAQNCDNRDYQQEDFEPRSAPISSGGDGEKRADSDCEVDSSAPCQRSYTRSPIERREAEAGPTTPAPAPVPSVTSVGCPRKARTLFMTTEEQLEATAQLKDFILARGDSGEGAVQDLAVATGAAQLCLALLTGQPVRTTSSCSLSTPRVGGPPCPFVHGGNEENSAFGRAAAQHLANSRDELDVDMPPELAGPCLQRWLSHEEARNGASTNSGVVVSNKQQHQRQQLRFFLSPQATARNPAALSCHTFDDDSTSSEDGEDKIEEGAGYENDSTATSGSAGGLDEAAAKVALDEAGAVLSEILDVLDDAAEVEGRSEAPSRIDAVPEKHR